MDYKDMFSQAKNDDEAREAQQKREAGERKLQAEANLRKQHKREYDFIDSVAEEVKKMMRGFMEAHGYPHKPIDTWGPSIIFEGRDFVEPGSYCFGGDQYKPNRMVAKWSDGCDQGNGYAFIKVEYIVVQNVRKSFFGKTTSWDSIGFVINDSGGLKPITTTSQLAAELAPRKPSVNYPIE